MRQGVRRHFRSKQAGYAVLLLMTVMGLGALFFLAQSTHTLAPRTSASRMSPRTADALRQAKYALIGYAATYPDIHPGQTFGYLPMPDMGGHIDTVHTNREGVAAAGFSGNHQNETVIGRLPWSTLNVPPLKDEHGECLWYIVSGTFKNTPFTSLMNWDTLGYLDVRSPDGATSLFGTNVHARPVAAVFSAGPPISGQNRSDSTEAGDEVGQCHGNYDVRNYLDPYSATTATGGHTNWLVDNTTTHHALDNVGLVVKQLLGAPLGGANGAQTLNDRAAFITSEDIFQVVRKRSDFIQPTLTALGNCLRSYHLAGNDYPAPYTPHASHGHLETGSLPTICSTAAPAAYAPAPYANHFFYLSCTSHGVCLHAYTPGNNPCKAAVIFGGARTASQSRSTNAERANAANYLEAPNFSAYDTATDSDLRGNSAFSPMAPSTDVVVCLNE